MVAEQERRETSLEDSDSFVVVKEWFNYSVKYSTFNHLLHACNSLNLCKDYHTFYCESNF